MDEFYGIWSLGGCYSPMILASSDYPSPAYVAGLGLEEEADLISDSAASCMAALDMEEDVERVVKSRIKDHPQYPRLLQAYVDCQKVGASGEIVGILDGITRDHKNEGSRKGSGCRIPMGVDPDLDDFMETYTEMLMKYREDLERPFNEANAFLEKTERLLSSLCNLPFPFPLPSSSSDEGTDEELCREDVYAREAKPRRGEERDRDLKDRLLERFRSHIGTLKMEFSKKRKKGKLPQEARQMLLNWWNVHNKWPYPTEADKITLAQSTGLDQKQINNWFINQRKRHWKLSESEHFALTDDSPGQFNATA